MNAVLVYLARHQRRRLILFVRLVVGIVFLELDVEGGEILTEFLARLLGARRALTRRADRQVRRGGGQTDFRFPIPPLAAFQYSWMIATRT
jgi:hypothetical protein